MITVYYGHRVTHNGSTATFGPDVGNVLAASAFESFVDSLGVENALSIDDLDGSARHAGSRFLLTFDDGYADNVTELLPILERMNLPAMIFITTGFLDDRMLPYGSRLALFLERYSEIGMPDGSSRQDSPSGLVAVPTSTRVDGLPVPAFCVTKQLDLHVLARSMDFTVLRIQNGPR